MSLDDWSTIIYNNTYHYACSFLLVHSWGNRHDKYVFDSEHCDVINTHPYTAYLNDSDDGFTLPPSFCKKKQEIKVQHMRKQLQN